MTPEGKMKAAVKKALLPYRQFGELYSHWPVLNGMGEPTLDCVGCYRGHFFAIETKAPGKKPTPRQLQTIAKMEDAGAAVFVIDDVAGVLALQRWLVSRPYLTSETPERQC